MTQTMKGLTTDQRKRIEHNVWQILQVIDDPERAGIKDTPRRVAKFYAEFLNTPAFELTCFDGEGYDQMIVSSQIQFYSLCEHHLAPFFGIGAIAYVPGKKIVGISKLARTLDKFARQLSNQERITQQVATYLMEELQPRGVGVILKARHMCQEMRGVEKPGTITTTSAMVGVFKKDHKARQEFLNLIK